MASAVASTSQLPIPARPDLIPAIVEPSNPQLATNSTNQFDDSNSYIAKAVKATSGWNAMLNYARQERGPQWDYSTSMLVLFPHPSFNTDLVNSIRYHVNIESAEYYAGVKKVPGSHSFVVFSFLFLSFRRSCQFFSTLLIHRINSGQPDPNKPVAPYLNSNQAQPMYNQGSQTSTFDSGRAKRTAPARAKRALY